LAKPNRKIKTIQLCELSNFYFEAVKIKRKGFVEILNNVLKRL